MTATRLAARALVRLTQLDADEDVAGFLRLMFDDPLGERALRKGRVPRE